MTPAICGTAQVIRTALRDYEIVRDKRKAAFQDWQSARQAAAEIKWEAVNHLDKYLEAVRRQTGSARHESPLGQHRRAGARNHLCRFSAIKKRVRSSSPRR